MRIYGHTSLSEFLGDNVIYRNLEPVNDRLPNLNHLRVSLNLPAGHIPRKSEMDYARVIVQILQSARALNDPKQPLERLIFVGDTRLNDVTAFTNICNTGRWPGLAFIGSENDTEPESELISNGNGQHIFVANRWASLYEFDQLCADRGLPVDQHTVVIIDLDKTALGARGRNDHVIDQARVQAVHDTVADLLGETFDETVFTATYDRFNSVEFHPFTTDNQDYLAYLCLIVGWGLFDADTLAEDILTEQLTSFRAFIHAVNEQSGNLSNGLATIHHDIYNNVLAGDPTPFKAFRRQEFRATVNRMGCVADPTTIKTLLANEIVITQEVRSAALEWKARGALLFGLSDKPDEASLPTAELANQGVLPLHRAETHVVGQPQS